MLLVLGFFIDMPRGELRFGVATGSGLEVNNSATPPAHALILNGGYAKVSAAKALYARLSLAEEFPLPPNYHPPKARFDPSAGNFLEEFTLEQGAGGAKVKADGLVIYRWLYDLLGLRDYRLVVTRSEPAPCDEGGCWRLTVNYTFADHADAEFIGPVDEIERDLAAFIVKVSVDAASSDWRRESKDTAAPPPFLFLSLGPQSFDAWEAAADGMSFLRQGQLATFCGDETELVCRERARAALTRATERSPDLSPGALGLAVIKLHDAFQIADEGGSPLEIERVFASASTYAVRALQNPFILGAVADGRFEMAPQAVNLQGFALANDMVVQSRGFGCALAEHRRAAWGKCLARVDKLNDIAPLSGLIDMMRFDALLGAASASDRPGVVTQLDDAIAQAKADSEEATARMLAGVRLLNACGPDDNVAPQIDETLRHLPTTLSQALFALKVMPCTSGEDRSDLTALVNRVLDSETESPEREMIALEQAILAAREGSKEDALSHLREAQRLPWAVDALANRGGEVGKEAVRRFFREGAPPNEELWRDLETCQPEGPTP